MISLGVTTPLVLVDDQVISLGRTTSLVDRESDLLGPYHFISGQGE